MLLAMAEQTTEEELGQSRDNLEHHAQRLLAAAIAYVVAGSPVEESSEGIELDIASRLWRIALLLFIIHVVTKKRSEKLPAGFDQSRFDAPSTETAQEAVAWARAHLEVPEGDKPPSQAQTFGWTHQAARTMATQAASKATLEAIDFLPGDYEKMWISRGDTKVRTLHRQLHGETAAIDKPFWRWPDGKELSFPGDPRAPLSQIINCRCILFPIAKSDLAYTEAAFAPADLETAFDVAVAASIPPPMVAGIAHKIRRMFNWDPHLHPRDKWGRFIDVDDKVDWTDARGHKHRATVIDLRPGTGGGEPRLNIEYRADGKMHRREVWGKSVLAAPKNKAVLDRKKSHKVMPVKFKEPIRDPRPEIVIQAGPQIPKEEIGIGRHVVYAHVGDFRFGTVESVNEHGVAMVRQTPSHELDSEGGAFRLKPGTVAAVRLDQMHEPDPVSLGRYEDLLDESGYGFADTHRYRESAHAFYRGGKWDPKRQELHDKIADRTIYSANPVDEPVFYLMGGGPASGKSTMLLADGVDVPQGRDAVQIDPDGIKMFLPEYVGLLENDERRAAAFVHVESSEISKQILRDVPDDRHVVLDGVGDRGADNVKRKLQTAKDRGQRVVANYATMDVDKSVMLAGLREEQTGRQVPEYYIRKAHADVVDTFFDLVSDGALDEAHLWDTDLWDEEKKVGIPRKIFESIDGKMRIVDEDLLQQFLDKSRRKEEHGRYSLDDIKEMVAQSQAEPLVLSKLLPGEEEVDSWVWDEVDFDAPELDAGIEDALPVGRTVELKDLGMKIPRAEDRRQLLDDTMARIDTLPPETRDRFAQLLYDFEGDITLRAATKSTQSIRETGRVETKVEGGKGFGLLQRGPGSQSMKLSLSRPTAEWYDWVQPRNKIVRDTNRHNIGSTEYQVGAKKLVEYDDAHPMPERWRLATTDEMFAVMVHELAHSNDFKMRADDETRSRYIPENIRESYWTMYQSGLPRRKSLGKKIDRIEAYEYGTTKPEEMIAEMTTFYLIGVPEGTDHDGFSITPEKWRDDNPVLATWVETELLNPNTWADQAEFTRILDGGTPVPEPEKRESGDDFVDWISAAKLAPGDTMSNLVMRPPAPDLTGQERLTLQTLGSKRAPELGVKSKNHHAYVSSQKLLDAGPTALWSRPEDGHIIIETNDVQVIGRMDADGGNLTWQQLDSRSLDGLHRYLDARGFSPDEVGDVAPVGATFLGDVPELRKPLSVQTARVAEVIGSKKTGWQSHLVKEEIALYPKPPVESAGIKDLIIGDSILHGPAQTPWVIDSVSRRDSNGFIKFDLQNTVGGGYDTIEYHVDWEVQRVLDYELSGAKTIDTPEMELIRGTVGMNGNPLREGNRTDRVHPQKPSNVGQCYEVSGRFVFDNHEGTLTHGIIRSEYGDVGHSWTVLPDGYVYEPTTDSVYHPDDFERIHNPVVLAQYDTDETFRMLAGEGHWGPYDEASNQWESEYHAAAGDHIQASHDATDAILWDYQDQIEAAGGNAFELSGSREVMRIDTAELLKHSPGVSIQKQNDERQKLNTTVATEELSPGVLRFTTMDGRSEVVRESEFKGSWRIDGKTRTIFFGNSPKEVEGLYSSLESAQAAIENDDYTQKFYLGYVGDKFRLATHMDALANQGSKSVDINSSATVGNVNTITKTRGLLREAAVLAREKADIPSNYRLEIGLRTRPVHIVGHVPTPDEVSKASMKDDLMDMDTLIHGALDGQVRSEGYVVHLYFSSPGKYGELEEVATVWLGDADNGPVLLYV